MFPEYFVAIVNSKVEFVGAHGPRESLEESSCTTYIAAVAYLSYSLPAGTRLLSSTRRPITPSTCQLHWPCTWLCPFHAPSSYYQLVHVYNMETSVSVFISYMWQSQVC